MEIKIIKKLECSKNKVFLAKTDDGTRVIFKKYAKEGGAGIEADILSKLSVTGYAPKVLEHGEDYNINEYVEGVNFMDKYLDYTMSDNADGLCRLANELSVFLQIFYTMTDGCILKEVNLKNFIIKDGRCYGIDYDNVGQGMQYTDVAGIVASAAYYAVGGVRSSFPFIRKLLKNFKLDMLDIINDVRGYLIHLSGGLVDIEGLVDELLGLDYMPIDLGIDIC